MKKIIKISLFIVALISLIITMRLFYNIGIFIDEYNFTLVDIFGGEFELMLSWINLFFIAALSIMSGLNMLMKDKKN